MPLTADELLDLISGDEPDYQAVAAGVDPAEALAVLAGLVLDPDVAVAGRAASLAAAIGTDDAVPVLADAAGHAEPGVRAAAAHGASRIGVPALAVIADGLADAEVGVRLMALGGLATAPLPPALTVAVQALAATDPSPAVRAGAAALVDVAGTVATAIADVGTGIADKLVAAGLRYARERLLELRDTALTGVPAFAAAAGVPAFADPAGTVAAALATARTELDLVAGALNAADFEGAGIRLGAVLRAVDTAATAAGGKTLVDLLLAGVGWGAVSRSGLARQLGLPATVPGLTLAGGALSYTITAPATSLAPAPLTLGFDRAELTARLRVDGAGPVFAVSLALTGLEVGIGGGPISSLLGGAAGSVQADVLLGVDSTHGLTLAGGTSGRAVLPARAELGPIDLHELGLELPPGRPDTIDLAGTITADVGGVITATVEGAGIHVHLDPAAVIGGPDPVSVSLRPPTGIGLALDTGLVRGGGFLEQRDGGFGGALQLRLGPVEVRAVGLLTLEPSFALVVVMSVTFLPPVDLTFGFTLNAVGGVIGIEHRLDPDALRAAVLAGSLEHVLFPPDPVAAAPAILDTLETVFPFDPGSVVIGPMVELGWGRPVSFLTAQLGVLLSLPDPRIVVIGRVRIALPAPQLPIIDLRATVYGEITPDHLLILVSLTGSRIAGFPVSGDIGLLLRWGGSPELALSAGGFHPRYPPPRELTGMARLAMDLSPPAVLTLRAEAYFALTSNSVQLGSHVELGADLGVADISGYFTFDALVLFSPRFGFLVDLGIGLTVRVFGVTLLGVHIQLHVEGTSPWRAAGSAEVEILWCTVDIDVGPYTWGDDDNPPPAPADPRQLVHDALHRNPGAWQALAPPAADRVVTLRPAGPSGTDVTVHPMGLFDVRQHAVPLETVVARVGASPVPAGQQQVHLGVPLVDGTPAGALSEVTDLFSAGTFLDLTDDEKLSRPAFEPMPAGARIRPPGEEADLAAAREAQLRYETFVCDADGVRGAHSRALRDTLVATAPLTALAAGAAGRSGLRAPARYATAPDPIVLADPGEVLMLSRTTLRPEGTAATYTHAAEQHLAADAQLARLGVA